MILNSKMCGLSKGGSENQNPSQQQQSLPLCITRTAFFQAELLANSHLIHSHSILLKLASRSSIMWLGSNNAVL